MKFLPLGLPWDIKNKDDGGARLLSVILTNGWLTNLYRSTLLSYHATVTRMLGRTKDKYKNRKIAEVKKWEETVVNIAADVKDKKNRKNKRQKLALLLEDYATLFEDQPLLIGPRILLILTLLAHASSEINWLAVHQNGQMPRKKKEAELSLYTTQETIAIIFYTTKLRQIVKDNRDLLNIYLIEALKGSDLKETEERLSQMDVNFELMDNFKKVVRSIDKISLEEGPDGVTVHNNVHVYDMGRLVTALSTSTISTTTTSSPVQMNPQMTQKLEIATLHFSLLQDAEKIALKKSDFNFLFFFKGTLEDYFNYVFEIPYNLGYIIAFPQICQEFVEVLDVMCAEEHEIFLNEIHKMVNNFFEKMAQKAVDSLQIYIDEFTIMEKKQQPHLVAEIFSAGEKEYRVRKKDGEANENESHSAKRTLAPAETVRNNLFESKLEVSTINLNELMKAFFSSNPIKIASYTFFPEAFLLDKLSDKIIEGMKGFYSFPTMPSEIKFSIKTYTQALIHIDPGLDIPSLIQDILFDLR